METKNRHCVSIAYTYKHMVFSKWMSKTIYQAPPAQMELVKNGWFLDSISKGMQTTKQLSKPLEIWCCKETVEFLSWWKAFLCCYCIIHYAELWQKDYHFFSVYYYFLGGVRCWEAVTFVRMLLPYLLKNTSFCELHIVVLNATHTLQIEWHNLLYAISCFLRVEKMRS